jgi:acetyl-CoA synthetase
MSERYPPLATLADAEGAIPNLGAWALARDRADHDPTGFHLALADALVWRDPPSQGFYQDFRDVHDGPLRCYADGTLNVTESLLDRHVARDANAPALLWEADQPGEGGVVTYGELLERTCRLASALTALGVGRGDRVILYMGMTPDAVVAMLAVARIGAAHSIVFGGFSSDALRDRIDDCGAKVVVTMDEGLRGGRPIPLKATVDQALSGTTSVEHVIVYRRTGATVGWHEGRDLDGAACEASGVPFVDATQMNAEDLLFILYTSGSTGRPKGLVHTCGGYLAWATYTARTLFLLGPGVRHGCFADIGWITGHTYIVYGPLSLGAATLIFESTPTFPDAGRCWDVVARWGLHTAYLAPTAIRTLAAAGDAFVSQHDRSSLRILGSVGEPINPEAWRWYQRVVGEGRCAVLDTWWQTETGGVMIAPLAAATPTKPGSATRPLPGVFAVVVDEHGHPIVGPCEGRLCLSRPWPGMARTVWQDHDRYVQTYFSTYPPYYFTGDGVRRDADGDHWITGRVDDVLNVSGHRMGTAEFEAALTTVPRVAESAVVGFPHAIKGQGVLAWVVLQVGTQPDPLLEVELQTACRQAIGAHARLDQWVCIPGLPKTRSGKVMRRILRKIAEGEAGALGDTTTLADPGIVEAILTAYAARVGG